MLFPVVNGIISSPQSYKQFVDLLERLQKRERPKKKLAVLTFNYDIALDFSLYERQINYSYCLDDDKNNVLPLLKLHGSLNWGKCLECGKVLSYRFTDFFKDHNRSVILDDLQKYRLSISNELVKINHDTCDQKIPSDPFIVPPTWNKTTFYNQIQNVWIRAAQELKEAEDIYIIGYSLPESDNFFKLLYALGVGTNKPIRHLWVINPDETVNNRFRALFAGAALSRYQFINENFTAGLNNINKNYFKY